MSNFYKQLIREEIARKGRIGIDPRHVEAYMRLEYNTLDGLNKTQFAKEVSIGIQCVEADGAENAEKCAQSFGL